MTVGEAVRSVRARLAAAGIPDAEAALDAAGLAGLALGWDRAALLARDRDPLTASAAAALDALVRRREAREPMAYLRGHQEFWGRDFAVTPAVLIPRPETELLIEAALAWRAAERDAGRTAPPAVLDLGTGSGCLAVTLACEWPDAIVDATDLSPDALAVAGANASRYGVAGRVRLHAGAYAAGLPGPFSLIVANPPYVAGADRDTLQAEVREYEPHLALFGGEDGLRDVRAILAMAPTILTPGGRLLMEIGAGQADAVRDAVRGTPGLLLLDLRADLQGIPRAAVIGRD